MKNLSALVWRFVFGLKTLGGLDYEALHLEVTLLVDVLEALLHLEVTLLVDVLEACSIFGV